MISLAKRKGCWDGNRTKRQKWWSKVNCLDPGKVIQARYSGYFDKGGRDTRVVFQSIFLKQKCSAGLIRNIS